MQSISFIFYGSLRDPERQKAVFGRLPIKTITGFIRGEFYVVTDQTDPYEVCKYPLVILKENGSLIASVLVTLEVEEAERDEVLQRLQEYEGPRYRLVEASFHGVENAHFRGRIFVGREDVTNDPKVRKLPFREIYDWQNTE